MNQQKGGEGLRFNKSYMIEWTRFCPSSDNENQEELLFVVQLRLICLTQ